MRDDRDGKPEFGRNYGIGWVLLCAGCGEDYLHHDHIEIFARNVEDATEAPHITISPHGIEMDSDISKNPSRRRDGLTVRFYCEACDTISVLSIAQHKGATLVTFEGT